MKCKIFTPAPWLSNQFSVYIKNLIALVTDESESSYTYIVPEFGPELKQNQATVLSAVNDCLPLVRKVDSTSTEYLTLHEDYETLEKMWKHFESKQYDCTDIFLKIVHCYYDTIYVDTHSKKTILTESEKQKLKDKLQTICDALLYLETPDDIINLIDRNNPEPYGISKNAPEYPTIFDENGNFIHDGCDVYYDREEYQKFLQQMKVIYSKIHNNISYKCSRIYDFRKNILYTGTRLEKDFEDKSIIMVKKLYVLFNTKFGKSYTQYIKAITNVLFPRKKRYMEQIHEILRPQSGSKTELKKTEKIKKNLEKNLKKLIKYKTE